MISTSRDIIFCLRRNSMKNTLKENAEALALKTVLGYINGKDPDEAIAKVLEWVDRYDEKEGTVAKQRKLIHEVLGDKDSNWYKLVRSFWTDIDPEVRKKTFENFIINATILGGRRKAEAKKKYGCNIPWTILIDPTSACNLHCIGCWAAEYGHQFNLSLEDIDSIVRQGKELIDDKFAEDMLRVKNFVPAISVEGFEEATDSRRGQGTYKQVERAMRILREHKLPFGVSCCYTHENYKVIGSEEYFDWMIDQGAKFAWFFTYMPIGVGSPTSLMVKADERAYMYDKIRAYRKTKPIFTMDFWNDGEYVSGCIAGGRYYFHVNANGDAEPCAFIHYSDTNLKDHSLIEALQGPLFSEYAKHQPFSPNYLRPCPLLDNKGALADMVHSADAESTDLSAKEDVDDLTAKCCEAADNWKGVADAIWQKTHPGSPL